MFFRITLPMLMPYMITAALFRLLDSIQQFDIIYSMTQGGPGDTLLVFQVRAYLEFFQYTMSVVRRHCSSSCGRSPISVDQFIKQWLKLRERIHARA